jgi:hypothetical protein
VYNAGLKGTGILPKKGVRKFSPNAQDTLGSSQRSRINYTKTLQGSGLQ